MSRRRGRHKPDPFRQCHVKGNPDKPKAAYETREEAIEKCPDRKGLEEGRIDVFQCTNCDKWHYGHTRMGATFAMIRTRDRRTQ